MAEGGNGVLEEVSVGDSLILGLLSVLGVAGFYLSPVETEALAMLDFGSFFVPSLGFIALLVFPVAWVANMSFDGFRIESLSSFIVLPGVFRGGLFAVVCVGLPLAVVFASYVVRSTYNGKNPFWTCFKSGSALVTVFALLVASAGGYTMMTDAEVRDTVRAGVSDMVADQAVEVANASLDGNGVVDQQQEMLVGLTSQLAQNVSEATLVTSQQALLVRMGQYEGTQYAFSSEQRTVVNQTFTDLRTRLPGELSSRVSERIGEQLEGQSGLRPSEDELQEVVEDRLDGFFGMVFDDTQRLAGLTFVVLLSMVYSLKVPFELFTGVVGYLLYRLVA